MAEANQAKRVHQVKIAGLNLRLKSGHSEEDVLRLVEQVDATIAEVQRRNPNTSFQNSLILAALQMAEIQLSEKINFKEKINELKADSLEILSEIEASPINQQSLDL